MNELALFAGIGGGILGGKLLGWKTVCAVEIDPFCARRLMQRQNEGHLPPFPIWDDVCTFDGRPWKTSVDVVSGGFPCQDISPLGRKKGIEGKKSGLWKEMARIICEIRSPFIFVENVTALTFRGLDVVLGDLAAMGYDAEWCVLGANAVGAPQKRERLWILGYSNSLRLPISSSRSNKKNVYTIEKSSASMGLYPFPSAPKDPDWSNNSQKKRTPYPIIEPGFCGAPERIPHRMDRLKAIGNCQVPGVAALAWTILSERIIERRKKWDIKK